MAVELSEITSKLHQECLALGDIKTQKLTRLLDSGNTFVELVPLYIDKYASANRDILLTVNDEFFLDIHASVTLGIGGYCKSSCVLMRAAIELGLYILYFLDHPVEVKMWASTDEESDTRKDVPSRKDMSFKTTLEELATAEYLRAASGHKVNSARIIATKKSLSNNYRMLSERVHGKYKFLHAASTPSEEFESFYVTSDDSLKALLRLAVERADTAFDPYAQVPSLGPILRRR